MELIVNRWRWAAGTAAPASTFAGCDTGDTATATVLRFHATALEAMAPVAAVMDALAADDTIRLRDEATEGWQDYLVTGAAGLAVDVWSVPVTAGTGTGPMTADAAVDGVFLVAAYVTPPTGWPTAADVAGAMGYPLASLSPEDQDWLAASTDSANAYAQQKSPAAWRLEDPRYPGPDLWQGTVQLAAYLFQRRATGVVAPDFGGDTFGGGMMDPSILRLLELDRHSPPRAV